MVYFQGKRVTSRQWFKMHTKVTSTCGIPNVGASSVVIKQRSNERIDMLSNRIWLHHLLYLMYGRRSWRMRGLPMRIPIRSNGGVRWGRMRCAPSMKRIRQGSKRWVSLMVNILELLWEWRRQDQVLVHLSLSLNHERTFSQWLIGVFYWEFVFLNE